MKNTVSAWAPFSWFEGVERAGPNAEDGISGSEFGKSIVPPLRLSALISYEDYHMLC